MFLVPVVWYVYFVYSAYNSTYGRIKKEVTPVLVSGT